MMDKEYVVIEQVDGCIHYVHAYHSYDDALNDYNSRFVKLVENYGIADSIHSIMEYKWCTSADETIELLLDACAID